MVEFCNGKIARHKIPKYWEFVEAYPMTASGKIQKYKIVEEYSCKLRRLVQAFSKPAMYLFSFAGLLFKFQIRQVVIL